MGLQNRMSASHRLRLTQTTTLTAAFLLASFAHGQSTPVLVPFPREVRVTAALPLASGIGISVPAADPKDREAAEDLSSRLKERGIPVSTGRASAARVVLLRTSAASASEFLRRNHLEFTPAMDESQQSLPRCQAPLQRNQHSSTARSDRHAQGHGGALTQGPDCDSPQVGEGLWSRA
jgi:hypothetical protein